MKKILILLPCLLLLFSFEDSKESKSNKIREAQIRYFGGEQFAKQGITGRGLRIAILDGGFPGANTHPALKHLIDKKQIIATWNFVRNREDVYTGVAHGTEVLGCIAGIDNGKPLGLAPDAEFLLAITEVNGEPAREEVNWAKAVDWAIEHGANIIQSSLGYTYQRYFTGDLDGKHSICALAAQKAARKGILIVNCMGNEGQSRWQTMVTPADADSILSVGAIDPFTGLAAGFSSVGPTADGRLKPNVCAPGQVVTLNPSGGTKIDSGTSFASPLVAGFAACTWQLYPNLKAQEILKLIEHSGHLYPFYDYSHGYGIPQAKAIVTPNMPQPLVNMTITTDDSYFIVQADRESPVKNDILPAPYIYYSVSNPGGYLVKYGVFKLTGPGPLKISKSGFEPGYLFRCNLNGVTATWEENR